MNFVKSVVVLAAHSLLVVACSNDASNGNSATTDDPTDPRDEAKDDAATPSAEETKHDAASETTEPDGNACEVLSEAEPPSCEACLVDACAEQYAACFCDVDCMAQFDQVRECFLMHNSFDAPSDDPSGDWATCEAEAGEPSPLYDDLMACVAADYVPPEQGAEDDPWGRTDGDGQCSAACFDLFAFDFDL